MNAFVQSLKNPHRGQAVVEAQTLIDPAHQIRKLTIITGGRRVIAIVAGDLDQSLLGGRRDEAVGGAEKTLASELQD